MPHAPTERLVETQGIVLIRLADGRVAAMWEYCDQVGFRQQLSEGEPDKG